MFKTFLGGKIHRATVTGANLNYVGSITVDVDLLEAAGIDINERCKLLITIMVNVLKLIPLPADVVVARFALMVRQHALFKKAML